MDWPSVDWATLERLRAVFLSDAPPAGCYWQSRADLANYDFTFAQRIAWKWDAVLRELDQRGWRPSPRSLLDWGCGSGIAARRVMEFFGPEGFDVARFHDRSPMAAEFAAEAARSAFPQVRVETVGPEWLRGGGEPVGLLLLSHVLNELSPQAEASLERLMRRADAVLWVEPGTRELSRRLLAWRERLRATFAVVAPCTHQAACGLLAPENARHWCHHFATPPPALLADADWARFAQRVGVDLRSLPYSFLALTRSTPLPPEPSQALSGTLGEGFSRVIGRPRFYKGYVKVFSCQADGVRDVELLKRADPALFKELEQGNVSGCYRWKLRGGRIVGGESLDRTGREAK